MIIHKIQIWPALQDAFRTLWRHKKILFGLTWFCLLLQIIMEALFSGFLQEGLSDFLWLNHVPFSDTLIELFAIAIYVFFSSIIYVAFYRFLITGQDTLQFFTFRRGAAAKKILKVPYRFSIGQHERAFMAFSLIYMAALMLIHNGIGLFLIEVAKNGGFVDASSFSISVFLFSMRIMLPTFFGVFFILFWPYLATKAFLISDIPKLVKTLRGNIVRIFVFCLILNSIYELYIQVTASAGEVHSELYVLMDAIMYCLIDFLLIVFASRLYKKLIIEKEVL